MPDDVTALLCKSLSGDNMMAHLNEFARRVKLSGTPEELESFRYLKSRLDSFGFQTNLIQHDAYISLPGKAALDVDNAQIPCITHSFSRPSPAGGTRGQLVAVGRGAACGFRQRRRSRQDRGHRRHRLAGCKPARDRGRRRRPNPRQPARAHP